MTRPPRRPTRPVLAIAVACLSPVLLAGACQPAPRSEPQDKAAERSSGATADDPLASLRSSEPSTRYTNGYWLEQGRSNAGLWSQATAYCGDDARPRPGLEADGAKPNCRAVHVASFQLRDERLRRARLDSARAAAQLPRDPAAAKRRTDALENTLKY